jgi:hypothetical protein
MFIHFEERLADSPFVERVWRSHSERADAFSSVAAANWEMVVSKHEGKTSFIVRGPETRGSTVECPAEGEWVAIRFKVGTYMPLFLPSDLRDRNDKVLPDASSRSFWLQGSAIEHPTFENAEVFVKRLVDRGLIKVDPVVSGVLNGDSQRLSTRTAQRRFLKITGLTQTSIEQIHRARRTTLLLKHGRSIADAVFEGGYYDQAHLTRSLKYYVGQTPGQILRNETQLSFLYNTDPA